MVTKRAKPKASYVVRDGDHTFPVVDMMFNWLLQQAKMALSERPRLRLAGRAALKAAAADLVSHRARVAKVSAAMILANQARAVLPPAEEIEAEINAKSLKGVPEYKAISDIAKSRKGGRRPVTQAAVRLRRKKAQRA